MAIISELKNQDGVKLYPITKTSGVFNANNQSLDTIISIINNNITSVTNTVKNQATTLSDKAPIPHASTDTTYGVGTNDNYGHVKLSDSTSLTFDASSGVAASPKAVKAAYDLAAEAKAAASSSGGSGNYTLPAAGSDLGGVKSGGDVTITDGVITVKDRSHNHSADDITSGTLSLTRGGTGKTTAAASLYALVNGSSELSSSSLSSSDYIALADASASTGKKVTLDSLTSYIGDILGISGGTTGNCKIEYGTYVGTGTGSRTLNFNISPKLVVVRDADVTSSSTSSFHSTLVAVYPAQTAEVNSPADNSEKASLTWSSNSLSWTGTSGYATTIGMDAVGDTYTYVAIGV